MKILSAIYLKVLSHTTHIKMVKNTTGGNANKKQGRKFMTSKAGNKLRISEDDGELYAVVTKNLGNNMFNACSTDGTVYLGHIRGKFSGRGRRDNTIVAGVWVLIGIREWDNAAATKGGKAKMPQSDLLEVYTEMDKQRLKDTEEEDWEMLLTNDPTRVNKEPLTQVDEIHWQTDKDVEQTRLLEEIKSGTCAKISLNEDSAAMPTIRAPVFDLEVYVDDI